MASFAYAFSEQYEAPWSFANLLALPFLGNLL